ncbi:uncharacterized protein BO66DRAFT_201548 [Aspergillus aculeatinus CBS 121060]|uniref:Uncharacterized protein n=1 Tax=Aspergillus aculeatinus CBS 121060 TaxID=1448322 RepID=A0ACD1HJV0_9EURO|nr:hypothetical protein BO66DRAFT_201548 [Aspergillus aculeatinus CBS 121060]RAH73633.1 hypothetical protein BO66DRAFT_201548 [Aspergillus aculeatinus CBS 121060]
MELWVDSVGLVTGEGCVGLAMILPVKSSAVPAAAMQACLPILLRTLQTSNRMHNSAAPTMTSTGGGTDRELRHSPSSLPSSSIRLSGAERVRAEAIDNELASDAGITDQENVNVFHLNSLFRPDNLHHHHIILVSSISKSTSSTTVLSGLRRHEYRADHRVE